MKNSLSGLSDAVRKAKLAPPLHPRHKVSERIGYYYIDDPNRTFAPITVPRNRYRNVKWIYPSWSKSNLKLKKADKVLKKARRKIGALISENDGLRREYKDLRRRCRSAMRKELARLTSPLPLPFVGGGKTSFPTSPDSTEWDTTPFKDSSVTSEGNATDSGNIETKLKKDLVGRKQSEVLKLCGKPNSRMAF